MHKMPFAHRGKSVVQCRSCFLSLTSQTHEQAGRIFRDSFFPTYSSHLHGPPSFSQYLVAFHAKEFSCYCVDVISLSISLFLCPPPKPLQQRHVLTNFIFCITCHQTCDHSSVTETFSSAIWSPNPSRCRSFWLSWGQAPSRPGFFRFQILVSHLF